MAVPPLFVAVVSHEGSRFPMNQGPQGLAARLAEAIPGARAYVSTADLIDEAGWTIDADAVQDSLTAQLRLDREWAQFLGQPLTGRTRTLAVARRLRRSWHRVRPPDPAMVRRLVNIELAHTDLMRRGLDSGAPWVLVVEDDGVADDTGDLAAGLTGIMTAPRPPLFANVSASFSTRDLGIDHLLSPIVGTAWQGSRPRALLQAERPVTNTVCAILYSRGFLADLVATMGALPLTPVVPIDWKLNIALMRMFEAGAVGAGDCWLVEPAPIAQMSMRPAEILPS